MIALEYTIIISVFILYYFTVLFSERKLISEPKDIISRFLSVVLLYAGISLIYFSLAGKPLFNDSAENYSIYIFIMGFVAILWTVPDLLSEFDFFKDFLSKRKEKNWNIKNNKVIKK